MTITEMKKQLKKIKENLNYEDSKTLIDVRGGADMQYMCDETIKISTQIDGVQFVAIARCKLNKNKGE